MNRWNVYHVDSGDEFSVNEAKIRGWYSDAVANDEAESGLTDIGEIVEALNDVGDVTISESVSR